MTVSDIQETPLISWRTVSNLPSTTLSRFLLLIGVLFVGAVPYYHWWAYYVLDVTPTLSDCGVLTGGADPAKYAAALAACPDDVGRAAILLELAATGTVIVVAVTLYLLQPWWYFRQHRLKPVDAQVDSAVHAELTALVVGAQLRRAPTFVVRPIVTRGGLTFGRFGRYYISLDEGLLMGYSFDPGRLRATVRHELAHLQGRDVDLTYLALSFWRAFLLVVVVPAAIEIGSRFVGNGFTWSGFLFQQAVGLAFIVALVHLALRSVLRVREFHADVRSAADEAGNGALAIMLDERVLAEPDGFRARLRQWKSTHPSDSDRAQVLRDPTLLFQLNAVDALVASAASGFGLGGLYLTVGSLVGASTGTAELITAVIASLPIAAVIGAGAIRSAFAGIAGWRRPPLGIRTGICAAAGFVAGESLSWSLSVSWSDILTAHPWTALWMAVVLASGFLLTARWIIISARIWVDGRKNPPASWSYVVLAVLATAPFALTLTFWQLAHQGELPGTARYLAFVYGRLLLGYPGLIAAALTAMALAPVLGGMWRHGATSLAWPLALSIAAGAMAAVFALVFLVQPLDSWWLSTVPSPSPSDPASTDMQFITGQVAGAVALAAFVAAYVGRRGAALGAAFGLVTAGTGGAFIVLVGGLNRLVRTWTSGRPSNWDTIRGLDALIFRQALIAAVALILVAGILGRLTGLFTRLPAWPKGNHWGETWRSPTWVAALTALSLTLAAAAQATYPTPVPGPVAPATPASSPSPTQAEKNPYVFPADLGDTSLCAWFPMGYLSGEMLTTAQTQGQLAYLSWTGTVLEHADNPDLAKLGKALTAALIANDSKAALTAVKAIGTKCLTEDDSAKPGTKVQALDQCLVGSWTLTAEIQAVDLVPLVNENTYTSQYTADGNARDVAIDYRLSGTSGGVTITIGQDRTRLYNWSAWAGIYLQSHESGPETTTIIKNSQVVKTVDGSTDPGGHAAGYTCNTTTLHLAGSGDDAETLELFGNPIRIGFH
ncbi:M48 family metalloprotease [Frankia sp. Cj3]|uniref:M48 family metalloprotease n=1 Tax=Frankia sp. Cj3 TaxID=2880976 RepID=UPI001EF4B0D0|nr:M48 family metalloprotease [Frankia sp. Cj3]